MNLKFTTGRDRNQLQAFLLARREAPGKSSNTKIVAQLHRAIGID
ncbi:MAG: hypothetical protein WCR74_19110 [Betaproteobacteria bacterium]